MPFLTSYWKVPAAKIIVVLTFENGATRTLSAKDKLIVGADLISLTFHNGDCLLLDDSDVCIVMDDTKHPDISEPEDASIGCYSAIMQRAVVARFLSSEFSDKYGKHS